MLKRRRGAMDDEAEQPDFAPPPTTLRRLNLAMDASPAINQATPGFRETVSASQFMRVKLCNKFNIYSTHRPLDAQIMYYCYVGS